MRRYVEIRRAEVTTKKRQEEIMKYLSKNQDVIKEDLVNALTGKFGSRHTIYNAINELEELKKVIVTRVNRQLHRVSINPRSELNKINDLKRTFFDLIDEAALNFSELRIKAKEDPMGDEDIALAHASMSLTTLFEHVLAIFMLYLMFIWPKKVPDIRIREKVYEIAFQAVKEMQLKLEEAFGIGGEGLMEEEKGFIVADLFSMNREKLYSTIINLEYIGVGERAEALLDILWKLGLPFIPDALFEMYGRAEVWKKRHRKKIDEVLLEAEDWRNLVKSHVNSLSPDKRKWARSVSDKY